jgi:RNA polymerase sigma-70 factor (ECF subfamily)
MEGVRVAISAATPFETAVLPHYAGLVRRLTLLVGDGDQARDLAQTTCLRAWEAWNRFDGADVRAWLYTIGIRLALNEVRRRRRLPLRVGVEGASWAMAVDPDLWTALASLERRQRAALLLNVLDGYSQVEIGHMLGVPPGTVASWLARAKARLRLLLIEEDAS